MSGVNSLRTAFAGSFLAGAVLDEILPAFTPERAYLE